MTKAVVFDLFGTLVRWPDGPSYTAAMAEEIGIPYEAFRPPWSRRRRARDVGELTVEAALRAVGEELAITLDDECVRRAVEVRELFFRHILVPRDGALETLDALRSRGLKVGLVSDASLDVPPVWPGTAMAPFVDASVFSSIERSLKPDPRLYAAVSVRLGVASSACLYVGNGDGDELAGAVAAGMRALLFTWPGEFPGREAATWGGPRISVLADLLGMV